jgi:signal transduction histidine kinase
VCNNSVPCPFFREEEIITDLEAEITHKNGEIKNISVSSANLYDINGNLTGCVQTFRDITEAKKRQDHLRQTEKLATIGQLAAGVAHEINNPLGNILGYAKLITQDDTLDEVKTRAAVVLEEARKCSKIIRGLLDYSRTSASESSDIDLNEIVERVIIVLKVQADKREIRISTNPSPLPLLHADGRKIEQVVFNLVLNAIQAVECNGHIHIETDSNAHEIFLILSDDGPGISKNIRSRIFDPFFSTKPVGEGTGLGLAICTGIVSELGGRIEMDTEEGSGTKFNVFLPLNAVKKVDSNYAG